MPWRFTPSTYDGTSINDASYESKFLHEHQPLKLLTREPIETQIPGDYSFPASPRSQAMSGQVILTVRVKTQTQAGLNAARRLFDRYKGFVNLGVTDGDSVAYTLSVKCVSFTEREDAPHHFTAILYTNRPILESAQQSSALQTITVTPTSWEITTPNVKGTVRTYPLLEIEGDVAKANTADYTKRWQVTIAWRSEYKGEDSRGLGYPIDITADAFDTAAEVTAVRMQADGDDLRVFVDGEEYPRVLDGINTTTTKVWVPIHFSPGRTATLTTAMASGADPANGGVIVASNGDLGLLGWPDRGYAVIDNETFWYGSRTTDKFTNIKRGVRGSTAAAHSAAVRIDWVEHDIQIIHGYTAAVAPTLPEFAIDTAVSTNIQHKMTGFFTEQVAPVRYGQIVGRYTEDNIASASLSLQDNNVGLTFCDKAPGSGGYYPYNNAELYVPCGVKAAASAITYDITGLDVGSLSPGADVALTARVYGVDVATGVEKLLASYDKAARGAAKTITPDSVLSRLRFNALYTVITGCWLPGTPLDGSVGAGGAGGNDEQAQRFTLDGSSRIRAFALYVRKAGAGDTRTIATRFGLPVAGSGAPEPHNATAGPFAFTPALTTAYQWIYTTSVSSLGELLVPAGAVWDLISAGSVAGAGTVYWAAFGPAYARGRRWTETGATWTENEGNDYGFLIIGDGTVVQADAPRGMEGALNWDNLIVNLDDTTPRTPKIVRNAQENIYFHRGILDFVDIGSSLTMNHIAAVGEVFTVDAKRKLVIIDDARGIYAPGAITPSDPEQWGYFQGTDSATANTMRYTETGIGTVKIQPRWTDNLG